MVQAGDVLRPLFRSLSVASTLAEPLKPQVSSSCPTLSRMQERNLAVRSQSQVALRTLPHTLNMPRKVISRSASAHRSRKVHLFISLRNVYGEKLSARENKFSGEILPFVRYLFL